MNEVCTYHDDLGSKKEAEELCKHDFLAPKRVSTQKAVRKVLVIVFWDAKGVFFCGKTPN